MEINPNTLEIEIVDIEPIDGGIQVFARAWSDGKQIGFGKDGTVDIERFHIFNPPVLVEDVNGDITRTYTEVDVVTNEVTETTVNYREDPTVALLQSLESTIPHLQNIHDASNIVVGKMGNTTTTVYPQAGDSAPCDSGLQDGGYTTTAKNTWDYAHDADGTKEVAALITASGQRSANPIETRIRTWTNANGWIGIYRPSVGFNTSAIGTDTISSATLSLYGETVTDNFSQSVAIDAHTPTVEGAMPLTDYAKARWDGVDQATRIAVSSLSTGTYNVFTLNAAGIASINKTANTFFGARMSADMDDSAPSWSSNKSATFKFYSADEAGTTKDPKLVVEHSAATPTFIPRISFIM